MAQTMNAYLAILVIAALFFLAFFFKRLRYRRKERLGRNRRGFAPSYTSLGNALQTLQMFTRPTVCYVLQEKAAEKVEDEADGAPEDPSAHLDVQPLSAKSPVV